MVTFALLKQWLFATMAPRNIIHKLLRDGVNQSMHSTLSKKFGNFYLLKMKIMNLNLESKPPSMPKEIKKFKINQIKNRM